jgi:5-(carboxyamino)imidazole ribonucleotide synthase
MHTLAAQRMGYRVAVLDPDPHSSAGAVADRWIRSACGDEDAIAEIESFCAGAISVLDDVPQALARFADRCPLIPRPALAALCRDRARWAKLVERCDVDVCALADGAPQQREIAIVVARRGAGELACYAPVEICRNTAAFETSIAPARISRDLAARARAVAERIAEILDLAGVLCVELALSSKGALAVRALLPQPNACGYHTVEACATSQFEQQVRTLAGMPLGPTEQRSPAVVVVLPEGPWHALDRAALQRRPGVTLHLHGSRHGRVMAHVTVLAAHIETALETARAVRTELAH